MLILSLEVIVFIKETVYKVILKINTFLTALPPPSGPFSHHFSFPQIRKHKHKMLPSW